MTTEAPPFDPAADPSTVPVLTGGPEARPGPERAAEGPESAPSRRRTAAAGWAARWWRGRPEDPRWVRPALLGLLAGTALLYLWSLSASGWANSFYSAAVLAGTKSWKAFFFGSFDAANLITVDKPPASLWVMDLSARVFGLSSWSILVPEALMGTATVGVVYATVRRWFGAPAGLIAGAVTGLTPVAVLMFRFNNPDALLVLLLSVSAYTATRALERASTGWLVATGALVGAAFLTKMLQALLVVPALGLVYLVAAPTSLRRRLLQLLAAGGALVVAAGWWVAAVTLWPAASRPYIGGSQTNSVLELIFGYNGFGRLSGNETGSVTGGTGAGGGSLWGPTGWTRLFNDAFGGQTSWLLPAALVSTVAIVVLAGRRPRTDRLRAAALLWGGWLVVTGAVISFSQGIIHPYYTVALAPAIGALCGIGASELWRCRAWPAARLLMAAAVAVTAAWSFVLLDRTPSWNPWLRVLVLVAAALVVGVLVVGPRTRRVGAVAAGSLALVVALSGPAAYAVSTADTPHDSAIPSAGPTVAGSFGFGAGGGAPGFGGGTGSRAGGTRAPGASRFPGAGGGAFTAPPSATFGGAFPGGLGGRNGFTPNGSRSGGGPGGLLQGSTPGRAVVHRLERDAGRYTWVAAAVGANQAAGYELATGDPVMALGGFNGSDPDPTLAQFERDVRAGKVHYFIAGGGIGGGGGFGGANGGSNDAQRIATWVAAHYSATTVAGVTLYDLSSGAAR